MRGALNTELSTIYPIKNQSFPMWVLKHIFNKKKYFSRQPECYITNVSHFFSRLFFSRYYPQLWKTQKVKKFYLVFINKSSIKKSKPPFFGPNDVFSKKVAFTFHVLKSNCLVYKQFIIHYILIFIKLITSYKFQMCFKKSVDQGEDPAHSLPPKDRDPLRQLQ